MAHSLNNDPFLVDIELFKGTLFELVQLCKAAEVDPLVLRLKEVAKQIDTAKLIGNFKSAPDFIELYTQLIYLKSKYLLPPQEEDNEEVSLHVQPLELLEKIEVYFRIKKILHLLEEKQALAACSFPRPKEPACAAAPSASFPDNPDLLHALLQQVLARTPLPHFEVHKETVTVDEKIKWICQSCPIGVPMKALTLFSSSRTVRSCIVTFLALLELLKDGRGILEEGGDGVYFTHTRRESED